MGSNANNSSEQQDFYLLLVFRFLFYVYFCYKLLQLMFGSPIFNLKARIHRKIQFSYNELIAKQLSEDDIHGLQQTIANTLRNAQQPFNIVSSKLNNENKKQKNPNKISSIVQNQPIPIKKKVSFRQEDNQYFARPVYSQISNQTLDSVQNSKQKLANENESQKVAQTSLLNKQKNSSKISTSKTGEIIQHQSLKQQNLRLVDEKGDTHYPLLEQISCEMNQQLERRLEQQQENIEIHSKINEKQTKQKVLKYDQEVFSDSQQNLFIPKDTYLIT